VYYQSQKDKEPPRDLVKTIGGSRGEITLQPDQSGHYKFTFTHLSDANYKKIPLNGPSIEQVIHPLASADFASRENTAPGRTRRLISSCGGSHVDVPVDLKVYLQGLSGLSQDLLVRRVLDRGTSTSRLSVLRAPSCCTRRISPTRGILLGSPSPRISTATVALSRSLWVRSRLLIALAATHVQFSEY